MTMTARQQAYLDHFASACQGDTRIEAAFIGGSLATGTADSFSDLDLYLIIADSAYGDFYAQRHAFIAQMGSPVYLDDFDGFGFDMVLFIFSDGVHGELSLGRAGSFLHIHGGPYQIVLDRAQRLRGIAFPLDRAPADTQQRYVQKLLQRFWRNAYLFHGALARERLITAAEILNEMRQQLLRLCRISVDFGDNGSHPPPELCLSNSLQIRLAGTYSVLEPAALASAASAAEQLFGELGRSLAAAHALAYPEALEHVARQAIEP